MSEATRKDLLVIVGVLGFVFLATVVSHFTFVHKGGSSHGAEKTHGTAPVVSVFSTKEECEKQAHAKCVLNLCDDIPEGKNFEEFCGQGYRQGWTAEKSSHH